MTTNRITNKMLENLCERINTTLGRPIAPYRRDAAGKLHANIGNFHIDSAYGGVTLHEMQSVSGGVRNVFGCGYVAKRELWDRMQSFPTGLSYGKE